MLRGALVDVLHLLRARVENLDLLVDVREQRLDDADDGFVDEFRRRVV